MRVQPERSLQNYSFIVSPLSCSCLPPELAAPVLMPRSWVFCIRLLALWGWLRLFPRLHCVFIVPHLLGVMQRLHMSSMRSVAVLLQIHLNAQPQACGTQGAVTWLPFTPLMAALEIHSGRALAETTAFPPAPHCLPVDATSLSVTSLSVPCRTRTTWARSPST